MRPEVATTPPAVVSGNSAVLDSSGYGGPFIPGNTGDSLGVMGSSSAIVSPDEDLIIEVELVPAASSLSSALTANMASFLGGAGDANMPSDTGLSAVLRDFRVQEARPVFTREQVEADEARTMALRVETALGAAPPDQLSAIERLPSLSSFVRLRFPPDTSPSELTAALKRLPEVARAVVVPDAAPPMPGLSTPPPTDPLVGTGLLATDPNTGLESQWYLHRTRVPQAWRYARGANVVVADIDWGFRTSHQEFQLAIERTYNAFDGGENVTHGASAAHGTAVIGIAAARANNSGVAGYAPEATIWAIQGNSGPNPRRFEEPWAEAIDYVRRTDAGGRRKVIILEVQTRTRGGNYEQIPSVHRAIRAAIADGCVVCVAAGNGNRPADKTDADEPFDPTGSILVGATAYDDKVNKRAFFSNFGGRVVVSAPGDLRHDVTCGQGADNAYRNDFGGTSGATPKVAGTVALMLSVNPDLSHNDIRDILAGTGATVTEDPGKPIGVFLNAESAVAEALRRRSEALPADLVVPTTGLPLPEPPATKSIHGVRRRISQMVLPQDDGGPTSWDAPPSVVEPIAEEGTGAPAGEQPPSGDKTLKVFRESVEGTLTQQDRILIVEQAIRMLDNFYVHRPLKEAIHAVRPIQRLRVLLRRLQQEANIPAGEQDELAFHNTLTQIFNSVRDLHTSYQLPRPYQDQIAYLPFEVAPFYEDNQRRYLVTRLLPGYTFGAHDFQPGAELLYWNGMTIERAVQANADQTAGSNDAARHSRGVSALTIRPMNTALPPDADFVDLEFVPRDADVNDPAARRTMRQFWFVRYAPSTVGGVAAVASGPSGQAKPASSAAPPAPVVATPPISFSAHSSLDLGRESMARSVDLLFATPSAPAQPPATPVPAATVTAAPTTATSEAVAADLRSASLLGLDVAADAVREARQLIFDAASIQQAESVNIGDEVFGIKGSASPGSVEGAFMGQEIKVKVPWNAAFRARTLDINGTTYGHIHIRTFHFNDDAGFVHEFIRLLEQMPESGLILDVRGNGGGNIWAAESLLQTLTAIEIDPERMQFIVTPGTLDLCRHNSTNVQIPLGDWLPSLEGAVETGSVYSHAFPLTPQQERCNNIGQKYYGPVILIVDGNCYSATDIFAAGFQDHKIGKVLGVSAKTGAGGANVWEHSLLNKVLPFGWGLKPLPNAAGMRVAIRQCIRVGTSAGAFLEDFGVQPDDVHPLTREDVLEGDRKLMARAAASLDKAAKLTGSIKVTMGAVDPAKPQNREITIKTRGLNRLDFYIDDRPQRSLDLIVDAAGEVILTPSIEIGSKLKLIGYSAAVKDRPVAQYRGFI
ncbi:MAG: S8 family serine peptidase [Blastocatellia bacterium]